jgi:hypothetical protein
VYVVYIVVGIIYLWSTINLCQLDSEKDFPLFIYMLYLTTCPVSQAPEEVDFFN